MTICGTLYILFSFLFFCTICADYESKRPPVGERCFVSEVVENEISKTLSHISDPKLAWQFENCFPNTLDTTFSYDPSNGKPDTFVITGDIDAMWLRDSSAQVYPYVQFINDDPALKRMIIGVINRQVKNILIDPYANAFNKGPTGSEWDSDDTDMKPELHERKWEIDSLCYPIRLAYYFWEVSGGDISPFDEDWVRSIELTVQTFREQQRKENLGPYHFWRKGDNVLVNDGWGPKVCPNGLIFSGFRPSDDATQEGFLVPSNLFAVLSLLQASELLRTIARTESVDFTQRLSVLADECETLAAEVEKAIKSSTIFVHPHFGRVYAYEVDGCGKAVYMDDANVPSLLALPYLGLANLDDDVYRNTRNLVLSETNPYFFKGTAGEGIGGPHEGADFIWPMSLIMRADTASDDEEIKYCIRILRDTDANTGFMHEAFHKNNASNYTRSWFAWANNLFGELIYRLVGEGKEDLLAPSPSEGDAAGTATTMDTVSDTDTVRVTVKGGRSTFVSSDAGRGTRT